jgi:hypothetical protein
MEKYSNSGHPTTHFAKLGQQPNNWPNSCPASLPSSNTNTQNVGPAPAHCRAPAHRPSYTLPYRRRNRAISSLPPAAPPPSPVLRLPHPLLFYARQTLKTPTPQQPRTLTLTLPSPRPPPRQASPSPSVAPPTTRPSMIERNRGIPCWSRWIHAAAAAILRSDTTPFSGCGCGSVCERSAGVVCAVGKEPLLPYYIPLLKIENDMAHIY